MADAVTTKIIHDGPRNAIIKFTNISDGTGESAVTKVDVSALNGSPSRVRLDRIDISTSGMGVDILWDATADVVAITIPQNEIMSFDYRDFGGISNNAGSGITGDVLFTTVAADAGDRYTLILHMVKK